MRGAIFLLAAGLLSADAGAEFFEKKIRPVLAAKCYACHSALIKTPMGGLLLDSREGIRKGGDNGTAVIPGDPANSKLFQAISYTRLDLKMPPSGKLPGEEIADFRKWIEMGAPDPREAGAAVPLKKPYVDLAEGRKHWAFQPLRKPEIPPDSARNPIDVFLQRKPGATELQAAARRDWLRRVTFDLIGLPPTPGQIAAFLEDQSPQSFERVVDRLLASPQYGERWARHWLDLVRFAETNGHEFDNEKIDAWRYRDYVIRAFQQDVPYDQFVREHIAGDLLAAPRTTPDGAFLESPLGTNAYWFGEVLNSATDSVKSRADQVDNQIDVLSKTFLGLTVACARCHDHKFDPLPTVDYYSLAGYLHSTVMREAVIDSPARAGEIAAAHELISRHNEQIRKVAISSISPAPAPPPQLRDGDSLYAGFDNFDGWVVSGEAFRSGPRRYPAPNQPLRGYAGESMASSFGGGTDRLVGSLTSAKFVMPKMYVHVRLAGTKAGRPPQERAPLRMTVVADDHKSAFLYPDGAPGFVWKSARMTKEIGRVCYIEIVDRDPNGHIAVDQIVFSDSEKPPESPPPSDEPLRVEDGIGLLPENYQVQIREYQVLRAQVEESFPPSAWGMIAADENPRDVAVHIRGSHKNLGDLAPRRPLQVLTNGEPPKCNGSGRLELAEWMASAENPLTARVMVNRIWKHHFGEGLVSTTDNFGKMGERPSDPELLDWLASTFLEGGWKIKPLHRKIVLSDFYRSKNGVSVRRLEAEAVRDALLAVSGRLDRTVFGPSIMPHISKYQDGRGKPQSGPLDGEGRRSIYIQVRRNFLTPMFLAFDYPLPISTTGARGSSTVPSQALLMMNNELVAELARYWADRVSSIEPDPDRRIERMFIESFSRPPENWERRESLAFLNSHPKPGIDAWTDLAHVLFNSAEFLYVR